MAEGIVSTMFGVWNQWMAKSARTPTKAEARNVPAAWLMPSSNMQMFLRRIVMMPPVETTHSSRRGTLKIKEKPPAAMAAASGW